MCAACGQDVLRAAQFYAGSAHTATDARSMSAIAEGKRRASVAVMMKCLPDKPDQEPDGEVNEGGKDQAAEDAQPFSHAGLGWGG